MYALDDSDLPPSSVPDLKVRQVHLGIHDTPLATRETLNHTKKCLCSAISTPSLGYTPQKKNEWCEAIVLLTGMTTQALRFRIMKGHVQRGLGFKRAHSVSSFNDFKEAVIYSLLRFWICRRWMRFYELRNSRGVQNLITPQSWIRRIKI